MRYHLLSLHLFHSFSIIFRTNLLKVHFLGYVNLGCSFQKVFKYKVESGKSVPFVMLNRLVFMQSILVLPQSCLGLYLGRWVKC